MTGAPNLTEILALWAAEIKARRMRWIAGIATPADLEAVDKFVADRLKTTPETVRAAVEAVRPATVPREAPTLTQRIF